MTDSTSPPTSDGASFQASGDASNETSNKPALALYHYAGCPFCTMVDRVLDPLGLEVQRHDIFRDPKAREQLIGATGRQTVPVLKIGEGADVRWMSESRDIMRWLQEEYG